MFFYFSVLNCLHVIVSPLFLSPYPLLHCFFDIFCFPIDALYQVILFSNLISQLRLYTYD
jgi:hypothetical protein